MNTHFNFQFQDSNIITIRLCRTLTRNVLMPFGMFPNSFDFNMPFLTGFIDGVEFVVPDGHFQLSWRVLTSDQINFFTIDNDCLFGIFIQTVTGSNYIFGGN